MQTGQELVERRVPQMPPSSRIGSCKTHIGGYKRRSKSRNCNYGRYESAKCLPMSPPSVCQWLKWRNATIPRLRVLSVRFGTPSGVMVVTSIKIIQHSHAKREGKDDILHVPTPVFSFLVQAIIVRPLAKATHSLRQLVAIFVWPRSPN
jgi:hypothetical protein